LKKQEMKRISTYKEVFKVEGPLNLKDLKTTYRSLVKEWHPDKFQDEEKKALAEKESIKIINAYHFLVSIAPETKEANLEEYNNTIAQSKIKDFQHKNSVLEIIFTDGTCYEYFGVSDKLFKNFVNTDTQLRFARRKIFNSYLYRKAKKDAEMAQ
jgi:molecular chaperone HscB